MFRVDYHLNYPESLQVYPYIYRILQRTKVFFYATEVRWVHCKHLD
ncbi:hypothetical protein EG68_12022 [Paragonimus skrjabini miyazakii]|uniref:Uncharacterized protein n=1 Tax=Paragonimus skrjabini miyazakii TaxID=59628 RepID=A0A8S9YIF0_9TREM|nr:hypothetical protein EG68_12022 [Paragonimus skrjabini miyazakii]